MQANNPDKVNCKSNSHKCSHIATLEEDSIKASTPERVIITDYIMEESGLEIEEEEAIEFEKTDDQSDMED